MSEHDEQRPMTRRERRMREMAQDGAVSTAEENAADQVSEPEAAPEAPAPADPAPEAPAAEAAGPEAPEPELEISPYNEDGSLRTRAEMRALRAQALAGQEETAVEEAAVETPVVEAPVVEEPAAEAVTTETVEAVVIEEAVAVEEPAVEDAVVAEEVAPVEEVVAEQEVPVEPFEDLQAAPPTQPFSLEEVFEAENVPLTEEPGAAEPVNTEPMNTEPMGTEPIGTDAEPVVAPAPTEPEGKRRFWRRNKAAAPVEAPVEEPVVEAVVEEPPAAEPAPAVEELFEADAATVETEGHEAADTVAVDVAEVEAADTVEAADAAGDAVDAAQEAVGSEKQNLEYSFPDIQPPEEWRSVFDDPASRTVEDAGQPSGDFDTLIERAVAQEGAAASSNTAALIMPTHPEDTGGLAGPLGSTGELFITGSIELPKSLAETGGHSGIHDSIKMEPLTAPESSGDLPVGPGSAAGPTPVSAKSAVSARLPQDMPVVAKPAKETNKLPMILTVSGGVLLAAVAGLGVWGWMNGMFG